LKVSLTINIHSNYSTRVLSAPLVISLLVERGNAYARGTLQAAAAVQLNNVIGLQLDAAAAALWAYVGQWLTTRLLPYTVRRDESKQLQLHRAASPRRS